MQVIGAILFFICLSFLIVIFGVVLFAIYLKNKMPIFKEIQQENAAYHPDPYKDADFYSIGHEEPSTPVEIVDAEYRVLPSDDDAPDNNP